MRCPEVYGLLMLSTAMHRSVLSTQHTLVWSDSLLPSPVLPQPAAAPCGHPAGCGLTGGNLVCSPFLLASFLTEIFQAWLGGSPIQGTCLYSFKTHFFHVRLSMASRFRRSESTSEEDVSKGDNCIKLQPFLCP